VHGTIVSMKTSSIGKKQIPVVIGNWKMNPPTLEKAKTLITDIKKSLGKKDGGAKVYVAAPFPFITEVAKISQKTRVKFSAQHVFSEDGGSFTGEVSIPMLKSLGVDQVILGHSERRALGESNDTINKALVKVLKSGLTAVVCVGERVRDGQGDYFGTVETQIREACKDVSFSHTNRLIVAYEPIWAIGTGKNATAEDVQEMKLFIQKVLTQVFDRKVVSKVRVIYGGSVNKENAEAILTAGRADGFLIGGSSLKAEEFVAIIKIADAHA